MRAPWIPTIVKANPEKGLEIQVMESPFAKVYPTIYTMNLPVQILGCLNIKLNPLISITKAITLTESVFLKYNPSFPFTYYVNGEVYDSLFSLEKRIGTLSQTGSQGKRDHKSVRHSYDNVFY